MGTAQQTDTRVPRGLLSNAEREFIRGERDAEDPDGYIRNLKYRARKQMDRIEDDIELLREHGYDDLADEFYEQFSRYKQLEREVEQLRDELADEEDNGSTPDGN